VHYRFAGQTTYQTAYVPSTDRQGNNRRYVWSLPYDMDPMMNASRVTDLTMPIAIENETPRGVTISAVMEFFFTVNGSVLDAPTSKPFQVKYTGTIAKQVLETKPTGHILHTDVECENGSFRLGSGAGYFAADIDVPAAIANLGSGLDNSLIYGAATGHSGSPANIFSIYFGSMRNVDDAALPTYVDQGYPMTDDTVRAIAFPVGTDSMGVKIKVYDRATKQRRDLEYTFTGCRRH
jgi:hypothetical protein